jgi:hypothetical protein
MEIIIMLLFNIDAIREKKSFKIISILITILDPTDMSLIRDFYNLKNNHAHTRTHYFLSNFFLLKRLNNNLSSALFLKLMKIIFIFW